MRRTLLPITMLGLLIAGENRGNGQVLQLPTFRQFSIGTTVVVPDRGGIYLGGVSRARHGSVSRGIPGLSGLPGAGRLTTHRATGSAVGGSHAWATVQIHDLEAIDRALLADAPTSPRDAASLEMARKAAFLSRHVSRESSSLSSVAEIRAARARAGPRRRDEYRAHYDRGQRAELAGRPAAARAAYRIVAVRADGDLRRLAQSRLAALTE